jgi:hypothetical protein
LRAASVRAEAGLLVAMHGLLPGPTHWKNQGLLQRQNCSNAKPEIAPYYARFKALSEIDRIVAVHKAAENI